MCRQYNTGALVSATFQSCRTSSDNHTQMVSVLLLVTSVFILRTAVSCRSLRIQSSDLFIIATSNSIENDAILCVCRHGERAWLKRVEWPSAVTTCLSETLWR